MKYICLVLFVLAAATAGAETVAIQSGEHKDFSRLVLQLKRPSVWVFGRYGVGYQLRLKRPGITLDVAHVFDRIPKSHLDGIAVGDGGANLSLHLSCVCYARAFQDGPLVIYIDVRAGPPPAGSPFETVLPAFPGAPQVGPIYNWKRNTPAVGLESLPTPQGKGSSGTVGAGLDRVSFAAPDGVDAVPKLHRRLTEAALAADIARAATAGLLEQAAPKPSAKLRAALESTTTPARQVTLQDAFASLAEHSKRLTIEAPVGEPPRPGDANTKPPQPPPCLPDRLFDFRHVGPNGPPAERIAALRSHLVTEFDRPDVAAVGQLTHLYLSLGFGAEAISLPKVMKVQLPDGDVEAILARIVDGMPVPDAGRLRGQVRCPGSGALWALLAQPVPDKHADIDKNAILRGFTALPLTLRRLLGERLASRLLALGDKAAAHSITDTLSRSPGDPTQSMQLAQARVDLATDRSRQADAAIGQIAASNGPKAAEAALLLVQTALKTDRKLPADLPSTIAVWAKDYRGTSLGTELRSAYPLALALSGQMDAAFAATAQVAHPSAVPGTGRATLFAVLAHVGTDEDVLRHGLAADAKVVSQTREKLAARVLALGFPQAALKWLGVAGDRLPPKLSPVAHLLVAKAALSLGRADMTLRALQGQHGAEGADLRLRALAMGGKDRHSPKIVIGNGSPSGGSGNSATATGQVGNKALAVGAVTVAHMGDGTGGLASLSISGGRSSRPHSQPGPLALADQTLQAGERLQESVQTLLDTPPAVLVTKQ